MQLSWSSYRSSVRPLQEKYGEESPDFKEQGAS